MSGDGALHDHTGGKPKVAIVAAEQNEFRADYGTPNKVSTLLHGFRYHNEKYNLSQAQIRLDDFVASQGQLETTLVSSTANRAYLIPKSASLVSHQMWIMRATEMIGVTFGHV